MRHLPLAGLQALLTLLSLLTVGLLSACTGFIADPTAGEVNGAPTRTGPGGVPTLCELEIPLVGFLGYCWVGVDDKCFESFDFINFLMVTNLEIKSIFINKIRL